MPEENEVVEAEEEFDAAFAEKAEVSEKAEAAKEAPGEIGAEDDGGEVFDKAFDSAAGDEPAASDEQEDLAAKLEKTEAEVERLKQSDRSQRGRVSALTKKLVEQQAAQKEPPVVEQGKGDNAETENNDDDWEEFQREFPEMAAIVDTRLAKVSSKFDSVSERVDKVSATQETLVEKEITAYKDTQFDILRDEHEDLDEVKGSSEFANWRENASSENKVKIQSKHAEDASAVLHAFKEETGWRSKAKPQGKTNVELINERREKALKNSAGISSKKVGHSSKLDTESDDDFDAAFEARALKKEKERSVRY